MNELQVFKNEEFGKVRMVVIDSEPYFVGKDVTVILGYQNTSKALNDHVDNDDKLNNKSLSSLGQRGGWIINESGLYSLILSSKLPAAKRFKHWVTSEILPAIRKTGGYIGNTQSMTDMEILSKALLISQNTIAERDRNIKELEKRNKVMKPKADYFDSTIDCKGLTNFRETAKLLHVAPMKFIKFMEAHKFIYKNMQSRWMPYQGKNKGLFEIREYTSEDGRIYALQTLITAKGRRKLHAMLSGAAQTSLFR